MTYTAALSEIRTEYLNATAAHPNFNSPHEGLALIEEEFLRLRNEVFLNHNPRSINRMRAEAVQLAAITIRFLEDCT